MTHPKNKLYRKNDTLSATNPSAEMLDGNLFASNHANEAPFFLDDDLFAKEDADEAPLFADDDLFAKDNTDKSSLETQDDELFVGDNVHTSSQSTTNEALFATKVESLETWKVLIVDDEKDVHQITYLLLGDYVYQGKPLTFFRAYGADKAKVLLLEHPDIAVMLLDVVMETPDAGLQLVRYIRERLKNHLIRIILRTGQPGYAPEEDVILKYEINDYANKTDLTRQKLITLITASLRAYTDIITIESYRQNLEKKVAERTCELQNKNEELTALNRALVKLNQEKNEFLGIAAHDLKSPLATIQGLADLIQFSSDDSPPEESIKIITEYAQMIAISSQQMYELVTNILDANAIESGKLKVLMNKRDLRDAVHSVVKNYLPRAKIKHINLQIQSLEQECLILADDIAIRQVLENLISNAIKYSPSNKNVIVRLTKNENEIWCEIQDEGPGLDKNDLTKLFVEKYIQLTPKPTGGEHSTGLGLFIVKKLVEAMNGKVWCKSKLGKGTTFVVEFQCFMSNN
mgnify:CR=1 FL=1